MNIIIDENVSLGLAKVLGSKGYKVVHIAEEPGRGREDESIFTLCKKTQSILITRDHHFTNSVRFPSSDTKGIIYIRHGNLTSEEEIELVDKFLLTHRVESFAGKLIKLSHQNITIR